MAQTYPRGEDYAKTRPNEKWVVVREKEINKRDWNTFISGVTIGIMLSMLALLFYIFGVL